MKSEEQVALIDEAREKLRVLIEQADVPALYECYKVADMNLHWAKWLHGEVEEIMPELEYERRSS